MSFGINMLESIIVGICTNTKVSISISCVYCAPRSSTRIFGEQIAMLLTETFCKNTHFIYGAYNIDLMKYNNLNETLTSVNDVISFDIIMLCQKLKRTSKME